MSLGYISLSKFQLGGKLVFVEGIAIDYKSEQWMEEPIYQLLGMLLWNNIEQDVENSLK